MDNQKTENQKTQVFEPQKARESQFIETMDESKRVSLEEVKRLKKRVEDFRSANFWPFICLFVYFSILILLNLRNLFGSVPLKLLFVFFILWYASHALKFVRAWENISFFLFGKYLGDSGPGLRFMLWPFVKGAFVKMWVRIIDIPEQSVNTIEGRATIDIRIFLKVVNAGKFLINADDPIKVIGGMALGAVTAVSGPLTVIQLMEKRGELIENIKKSLSAVEEKFGVEIVDVRLDNIVVPAKVLEARENLAVAAVEVGIAGKKAEAVVITGKADGEARAASIKPVIDALGPRGAEQYTAMEVAKSIKQGDKVVIAEGEIVNAFKGLGGRVLPVRPSGVRESWITPRLDS